MTSIYNYIGNTPLIDITEVFQKFDGRVFAKFEGMNPSGSIKDRIVLRMIINLEKSGLLTKDKIILEASSGNTGISLAMLAAAKRYECRIIMSEDASKERKQMIAQYGQKLILTDGKLKTDGAIKMVELLYKNAPDKFIVLNQFANPLNFKAHQYQTSGEIWRQTKKKIGYLIAGIGTSGTLMGLSLGLKNKNNKIKIISAEPDYNEFIPGLKNYQKSLVPEIFNKELIDGTIRVHYENSLSYTAFLQKNTGIFAGISSGVVCEAAEQLIKQGIKGNIVLIFADRGDRYFSMYEKNPNKTE